MTSSTEAWKVRGQLRPSAKVGVRLDLLGFRGSSMKVDTQNGIHTGVQKDMADGTGTAIVVGGGLAGEACTCITLSSASLQPQTLSGLSAQEFSALQVLRHISIT